MTRMLDAEVTFEPVGQGLFCAGRINSFRFVYDCGTSSNRRFLDARTTMHRATQENLDLLVLSHLHEDHVNGIEELLRNRNCHQAVLPYLFPEERLMVAARCHKRLRRLESAYINFIADPASYLREFNVDRIVYLTSVDTENPAAFPEDSNATVPSWTLGQLEDNDETKASDRVEIRSHSDRLVTPDWSFAFYCKPGKVSAATIAEALSDLDDPIDTSDLVSAITDRMEDLQNVYDELFKKSHSHNGASVICLNGPRDFSPSNRDIVAYFEIKTYMTIAQRHEAEIDRLNFAFSSSKIRQEKAISIRFPANILTGDAKLDPDSLSNHFMNELDSVCIGLVPHHGAPRDWNPTILEKMKNCLYWVVSFGIGNQYKHPSQNVLPDLIESGRTLLMCNQAQTIRFTLRGVING